MLQSRPFWLITGWWFENGDLHWFTHWKWWFYILVGGWNTIYGNVIIPTDEIISFRGVGIPPTRLTRLDLGVNRDNSQRLQGQIKCEFRENSDLLASDEPSTQPGGWNPSWVDARSQILKTSVIARAFLNCCCKSWNIWISDLGRQGHFHVRWWSNQAQALARYPPSFTVVYNHP